MYRHIGNWVAAWWRVILASWIIALICLKLAAPAWKDVLQEGEFAFLPENMPSLTGERVYEDAWGEPYASNVVIVIRRERSELTEQDRAFISAQLKPALARAVSRVGIPQPLHRQKDGQPAVETPDLEEISRRIKTFETPGMEKILDSTFDPARGHSTMVLMDLPTEFFDARNAALIDAIEGVISPGGELDSGDTKAPAGLSLALSGSATVGRDMMRAAAESSKATELWTTLLVVVLLVLIYRAPILAIIPLATVGVATEFSLALLSLLARHFGLGLFNGIELYVKVLSYGAGVDYCLFLIARFKEELDEVQEPGAAVSSSIGKAGEALVASALTVICGIFMMVFADFGKFRQAGIAITISLVIVLIAAMTFTPALLRLSGRLAFWPHVSSNRASQSAGWLSATGLFASLFRRNFFEAVWQKTSDLIQARPGMVLVSTVAAMMPFAVIAVLFFSNLSYGLLTELPQDTASVIGARAIQTHYPAGIAGPVTLLLRHPGMDFSDADGQEAVRQLVDSLYEKREQLGLADIRSVVHPFGIAGEAGSPAEEPPPGGGIFSNILDSGRDAVTRNKVKQFYVGQQGEYGASLTRLDFVSKNDPFSRDSIRQFVDIKEAVQATAGKDFDQGDRVEMFAIGPTASIRDLKTVTDRDQWVVDGMVLLGIFLILLVLLKNLTVSVYLILSVFFSYLVTLGVTFVVFWARDPAGFTGLDWKVPTFLFTILIAVGEDYNIFLMARIREEQEAHGEVPGVGVALTRTGSIISSCGIIMAGTFSSLLAGTLVGLHQLGFALAFGVLLDTFVVRPILVPSFLVLLYQGRFRSLSCLLGLSPSSAAVAAPAASQDDDVAAFEARPEV